MQVEQKRKLALILMVSLEEAERCEILLGELGFDCQQSANGILGLELARQQEFDLIVADQRLQGIGGLEVCRQLREFNRSSLFLLITNSPDRIERILSIELGADECLIAPYGTLSFRATVRRLLRLKNATQRNHSALTDLDKLGIRLNLEGRQIMFNNQEIEFTRSEFELVATLLSRPDTVLSHSHLLQYALDSDETSPETITLHMSRLRAKLRRGAPEFADCFRTVHGVGYRFAPDRIA